MEIYNETVTDLLVDSWKRKPLEVRETINVSVSLSSAGFNCVLLNLMTLLNLPIKASLQMTVFQDE